MDNLANFDLIILGGGIHGTAVAAEATERGLSVCLLEKADFASGTSSASTKLIHGGLRYLENFQFRLVREALAERETLMHKAPHLVHPQQFILPVKSGIRSSVILRLGLWIYDFLAKRNRLPASKTISFSEQAFENRLQASYRKGYAYYDCWTDDARLVLANALQAQRHGASLYNYAEVKQCIAMDNGWQVEFEAQGECHRISGQALVNATGACVNTVLSTILDQKPPHRLLLVKGSHLIVRQCFDGDYAFIFQQPDGRVVFAIPYLTDFTLIGTTDVIIDALSQNHISQSEIDYLLNAVNSYFKKNLSTTDIIDTFSGVRALVTAKYSASKTSRDYQLVYSTERTPPLVSIYGGKLTTHRELAVKLIDGFGAVFPQLKPSISAQTILPGGLLESPDYDSFVQRQQQRYPWLPSAVCAHYCHLYGRRMDEMLDGRQDQTDLGQHFGSTLYQLEIDFLLDTEWVVHLDDLLQRRTKYGLYLTPEEVEHVSSYFERVV